MHSNITRPFAEIYDQLPGVNEKDSHQCNDVMLDYWIEHSKDASMVEMMLDNNAEEIQKFEEPEIMSYLPSIKQKTIVDMGAGIGYVCITLPCIKLYCISEKRAAPDIEMFKRGVGYDTSPDIEMFKRGVGYDTSKLQNMDQMFVFGISPL